MRDEAKVREIFAPARSRPVDVEGKRFKVNRERIVSAILRAPGGIEVERGAPTRWFTLAAIAAGVAFLIGSVGWLALRGRPGTRTADHALSITGVRGVVTRVDHGVGSSFAPGQAVSISPDGDFITAPQSEASFRAANGLEIQLFEKSQMSLGGLRGVSTRSSVNLATGYLRCRVPHLTEGHTFSVITPDATVVVHGTVFRVMVSGQVGATETCVRVEEGVVGVETAAGETLIAAAQSWGCSAEDQPDAPRAAATPISKTVASPKTRERLPEPTKAQPGTLDEENRLFQAGLSAERQGDARGAGGLFERLLSRYPDSPLASDTRRALARVKHASGREQ